MPRHLHGAPCRGRGRQSLALALVALLVAAPAAAADSAPVATARRLLDAPLAAASVAMVDGRLWVASRGGGLVSFERGARSVRFDVGRGLPSAIVHDLAPLPDGRLLAGTDRGLVLVDPRHGSSQAIAPPDADKHPASAADLVLAAPRGLSAVFQLTPLDPEAESQPGASLWRWDGKRVKPWDPQLGPALVATAGHVDREDGCFHIAGIQAERAASRAWYASDCGGRIKSRWLGEGVPRGTVGIAGLARMPGGRSTVLILVTQETANPASRRHVVMEMDQDGQLTPHCSNASFAEPVTGFVRHGSDLVIARLGAGVHTLGCGPPRPIADDPRLRDPSALASDPQAGLLVATATAVLQVKNGASPLAITPPPDAVVPADALPMQAHTAGSRVLLSSPTVGPLELERGAGAWRMARLWRSGVELPRGVFGPATYANDGAVLAVLLSQSVLRLQPGRARPLETPGRAAPATPLDVAATSNGLWIAAGATPFNSAGAGLQFIANDGKSQFVPLPDRQAQPSGRMLTWPDGRVWVGTRIGVVEAEPSGATRRVSGDRVEALYRNAARDITGAVGATVQLWDGERMVPVLFAVEPRALRPRGHPVDLVIDDAGRWVILYSGGQVVVLDDKRQFAAVLDHRSGIPPSSRRLLYLPKTNEILIGTAREGVFSLRWSE